MIVYFLMTFLLGALLAIEVWIGVTTGSAFSWASAAFISVMALVTINSRSRL